MSTFKVSKITGTTLPELVQVVEGLRSGAVIPFVGAGMSANNLNGSNDYATVIALIEQELQDLQEAVGNYPGGSMFLDSFKRQYLMERKHRARRVPELTDKDKHQLLSLDELRRFRSALAKFIVFLTRYYNTAIAERGKFYFSNYTPVEYSEDEAGGQPKATYEAFAMLKALSSLEYVLNKNHQGSIGHDLIKGVQDSLTLRYDTMNGKRSKETLHVDHIVWLTDILWLTIVIWLPLYPTARELAAEMSVVSDRATRTSERRLIRTAECFGDQSALTKHIVKRFGKDGNERDALIMDSHVALASAAFFSAMSSKRKQSVIFTTNFDRGLELALERIIAQWGKTETRPAGYRIVYPVLVEDLQSRMVYQDTHQRTFSLVWLARDWFSADPKDERNGESWIVLGETYELTDKEKETAKKEQLRQRSPESPYLSSQGAFLTSDGKPFPGPVVVKLHGAPLEPLGKLAEGSFGDEDSVRHYLVVSERQYIDTIINSQATLPIWLTSYLKEKDISFQGYSIEDWNIRLELARQPSKESLGKSPHVSRSAIVRAASKAELGLFERLGIGLATQELRDLVWDIHQYKDNSVRKIMEDSFENRDFNYLKAGRT